MKALIGGLALLAVLAVAVAGCGSSGGDESVVKLGSTSASEAGASEAGAGGEAGGGEDPALAYTECMRENGISDFPDPEVSGGRVKMAIPRGVDPESPAFQKAEEACRELMIGGPGAGQ